MAAKKKKKKGKGKARERNVPTLTPAQSRKRVAALRKAGCHPKTVKLKDGEVVVLRDKLCALRKENRELRERRKRNPRRPPRKWWEPCLASVAAQHHAKDPAAVCGAVWWRKPPSERARIVRELERGSARDRRRAVAIARAERNRHARARSARKPNPRKGKGKGGRKENPPKRRLYALAYLEQKPGDTKPEIYEHKFGKPRPVLTFKGGGIQSRGGRFFTRGGWIHD